MLYFCVGTLVSHRIISYTYDVIVKIIDQEDVASQNNISQEHKPDAISIAGKNRLRYKINDFSMYNASKKINGV